MCLSPEMDVVAGLVVGSIAVEAARSVSHRSQWPLAVLPAIFAVHQFDEAFVWWADQGRLPAGVGHVATSVYLAIAFLVLPVLVPVAVLALEPAPRRSIPAATVVLGIAVALAMGWSLAAGPVTSRVAGHHIAYDVTVVGGAVTVVAYVVATCGAMVVSRHRAVRWYGVVNLPAVGFLVWLDQTALTSMWCLWAALTSLAIVAQLRSGRDDRRDAAADVRRQRSPGRSTAPSLGERQRGCRDSSA